MTTIPFHETAPRQLMNAPQRDTSTGLLAARPFVWSMTFFVQQLDYFFITYRINKICVVTNHRSTRVTKRNYSPQRSESSEFCFFKTNASLQTTALCCASHKVNAPASKLTRQTRRASMSTVMIGSMTFRRVTASRIALFRKQIKGMLTEWRHRIQSRRELADLDHVGLRDIGMSPGAAKYEASKPFWMG